MKKVIVTISIIALILTGCFSYRDINTAMFVTASIIDVDEDQNCVIYVEAFHAYRSSTNNSEKGERVIFVARGLTFFEAMRKLIKTTSYKLNYEQNRVIIFTDRAAKYGIDNFLDILTRDQELLLRAHIMITKEKPEKLLSLKLKQEEYLGLVIYDLMESEIVKSAVETKKLYEYLNQRKIGKNVDVLTMMQVNEESLQENIQAYGGAVVQNDIFVDELGGQQLQIYNIMNGETNRGVLVIPNPQIKDKYVTMEIVKNSMKTELKYDGTKIDLKKRINVRLTIGEAQEKITLNKETITSLEEKIKKKIKSDSQGLFKEYQEKEIDIFKVQEELERKYPKANVKDALKITDLTVEVEPYIEGSSDIQSFQ